ncbi:transposase [Streptomyces sp. NBC_01764]|uniref:IS110 family transposase n=1 Tax=Streptomyces sp. NBC_01764 TaxID=2975935 RepID=UPI002B1CD623|nr:transposase [Streptomyces sp. NBC_01764]
MPELWAGTDAGKAAHHCTVIDTDGTKVLSRRVPNNEAELLELIGDVLALALDAPVTWAVDPARRPRRGGLLRHGRLGPGRSHPAKRENGQLRPVRGRQRSTIPWAAPYGSLG